VYSFRFLFMAFNDNVFLFMITATFIPYGTAVQADETSLPANSICMCVTHLKAKKQFEDVRVQQATVLVQKLKQYEDKYRYVCVI